MKVELKHRNTYSKTFFTQFMEFIFHVTIIVNPTLRVRISQSVFITVNQNLRQTSEQSYEKRNTKRTELSMSIACAIMVVKDKHGHCRVIQLLICVPHKALLAITSLFLSGPGKLDSVV
jgi:hypothetical protein